MKTIKFAMFILFSVLLFSCHKNEIIKNEIPNENLAYKSPDRYSTLIKAGKTTYSQNTGSGNKNVKIYKAEYLSSGKNNQLGRTIYFSDRGNKQLGDDFLPGFSLDGTDNISYYIDNNRSSSDLPSSTTSRAIDRAMATWDKVNCSNLGISKKPGTTIPTGFISKIMGYGGSLDYVADINHAGWLPGKFFDILAPEGSSFILAATFTIIFTDANGNAIDLDNNKKADVAWREIYYNDAFSWNDGSTYDVETIALHESGHGLSQAHFGTAFSSANGKLHFSPRAVMNAAYSGIQTNISKTDLAGHCSNWASWPNK